MEIWAKLKGAVTGRPRVLTLSLQRNGKIF